MELWVRNVAGNFGSLLTTVFAWWWFYHKVMYVMSCEFINVDDLVTKSI